MNYPTNGFRRSLANGILSLLILAAFVQAASAEHALKVINQPKGGKAMYGPVPGETTEAGAMGWILRSLHKEFGDKPQVSKLFQVRGTQSVAALFTLTNRNHGNVPWTGLVIAVKTATDSVEGGAVYDETSRFPASFNPTMKALFAAWHPFAAAAGAGKASALPRMQKFTARDNSASVDYPEGWKPSGNGGTLGIAGPNGEFVSLDAALNGFDTRNRNVQNIMRTVQQGGMPNSTYARAYYCAWDADLGKIFVDAMQRIRKQGNMPPGDFHIESQTPIQGNNGRALRCAHILARVRPQGSPDDNNQREVNAVICLGPTSQMGEYSITLFYTTVPAALADKERPLLGAMLASFQINWAVVNREANAYAAPAIEAIHKIGEASAAQAKAQHEANDIHNSSVYQAWDSQDKRSQAFENYQLGYSVVSDTGNTAHGTFWNEDADWLVKQHPNQFEYVNTPGYWKGVDY